MSEIVLGQHPDFPELKVVYSQSMQFGWVEPTPSEHFLAEYYKAKYRESRQDEAPTPYYVSSFMRKRAAVQRQFIEQYSDSQRIESVLDIGCGAGLLLEAFTDDATILVGYETDNAMADWAANNLGTRATINKAYFNPDRPVEQKFDLITMSHVLEHIREPQNFLQEIKNWLKPNGLLFLEVPNDPLHIVKLQVDQQYGGLGHLSFFSAQSLAQLVKDVGFTALKAATYGPDIDAYWQRNIFIKRTTHSLRHRIWRKVRRYLNIRPKETFDITSPLSTERDAGGVCLRCLARIA